MKKLMILLVCVPIFSFGQTIVNENVITVMGTSDKEIEPDWIQLGMNATENENTKKESDIVTMENSILKFIVSLGQDSGCFSVDRYSANAKFTSGSSSKFRLNKTYLLKISKTTLLDTIVAKCIQSGMDNIFINQIGHSKMDSLQNSALHDALISAKNKANLIAQTMDVSLGKVISVNEQVFAPLNNYQLDEVNVIAYGVQKRVRAGSAIDVQKIKITKTVIVKYEIK